MRRILLVLSVTLGMAAMVVVTAAAAFADPVNQPLNENNCHGHLIGDYAAYEPEGIGNVLGGKNVKAFQEDALC